MCQISFTINSSSNISAAEGRYKAVSAATWKKFPITVKGGKVPPAKTPDITVKGDYDLEIRIKDTNEIWSDWKKDKIKVAEKCNGTPNTTGGPNADAGKDSTITGGSVILDGSISKALGGIKSYAWLQESGTKVIIRNSNKVKATALINTNGTYVFKLTVTDKSGAKDSDTVRVMRKSIGPGSGDGPFKPPIEK